jgi:poly(hydroxyalkanoate) depolymerase family esterase
VGSTLGRARRRLLVAILCAVASMAVGLFAATRDAEAFTVVQMPYTQMFSWWSTMWSNLPVSYLPAYGGSATGGGSTVPVSYPGPSSLPGKTFSGTFSNAAGSRYYSGYVPSTYKAGTAVPLVVALHGCTQSADIFRQLSRWDRLAEAKGFIVVFPQQDKSNNQYNCWNFFQTADMQRGSGEPSLIAGITQWVQSHYSVDPKRTYVNGLSAGGAMSSVMAATYPDLYAAAGVGSGCEYASGAACAGYQGIDPVQAGKQAYAAMGSNARMMPVIVFEGDKDTTVPPVNAQQVVQQWQTTADLADDGTLDGSIPTQAHGVARHAATSGHAYSVSDYSDGHGGTLVESWLVQGMNHAWSGGCSCQQYSDPAGPDETGAMYAFFMKHPKP